MNIVLPCDARQTRKLVKLLVDYPEPVYVRVGRAAVPDVYENDDFDFVLGKANMLLDGTDLTIKIDGLDLLDILEQYYRKSEQAPARFYELPQERFLGVFSLPGADLEWLERLHVDEAETVDATGCIVIPGLVNAHMHTWQTALRGIAANWTLTEYFRKMHAGLATVFEPDDLYIATLVGALNQLNCGTTTLITNRSSCACPLSCSCSGRRRGDGRRRWRWDTRTLHCITPSRPSNPTPIPTTRTPPRATDTSTSSALPELAAGDLAENEI